MVYLVDRRMQGKNKSAVNRERFVRRFKSQIKEAVARAIKERSITDMEKGEKIAIPVKDVSEPSFGHTHGGIWETVSPGNRKYVKGDRVPRPKGGAGGQGKGQASNGDETGEDDFIFELTREEFLDSFFDDLALPDLVKTQLAAITEWRSQRAGYTLTGTPTNIHVLRSLRGALGRRIAIGGRSQRRLREAERELIALLDTPMADGDEREQQKIEALRHEIHHLRTQLLAIPFIDPFDLRYSNRIRVPKPTTQAVMFCLLDVSGSMDESRKDMAKRFFILLYLFLSRMYEHTQVVFIRHHTQAAEVDEHEFFHSRETGGTVVSSALKLLGKVMHERYASSDWNVYVAQASDGDNWDNDSEQCLELLRSTIMPAVQYYAYVEITDGEPQNLWHAYEQVAATHRNFAMQRIVQPSDIFPVFRELFRKQPS